MGFFSIGFAYYRVSRRKDYLGCSMGIFFCLIFGGVSVAPPLGIGREVCIFFPGKRTEEYLAQDFTMKKPEQEN